MDKNTLIQLIQNNIRQQGLDKELQGYKIFLFGSRANETNNKKSDIDVGIIGEKTIPAKTFFKLENLLDDIPTLLRFDLVDFQSTSSSFKEKALQNTEIIYE